VKGKLIELSILEEILQDRRFISCEAIQNCEWLEAEFFLCVFIDEEGCARSFGVRYGYSGKRSIEGVEEWGGVQKVPCPRVRPRNVDAIKWEEEEEAEEAI